MIRMILIGYAAAVQPLALAPVRWQITHMALCMVSLAGLFKIRIKSDFFKHKMVKTNDKIRRFGVVMSRLSRKNYARYCKLQHLK